MAIIAGIKVCKFGGSSVADSSQIRKVSEIIRKDKARRIVVVSAPKGVTDLLISCAKKYHSTKKFPKEEFDKISAIYSEIGKNLKVKKSTDEVLAKLKSRIENHLQDKPEYEDMIKAWGEYSNAKVIADYFTTAGIPARLVTPKEAGLRVSEDFGKARILDESYKNIRKSLKPIKEVVLFPGFYARTKTDKIATLSRGGSDLTGSILAAAVEAEIYENWTDRDGIRNADPNIVKNPQKIDVITYKEVRELAYMGFKVFHAEAMIPVMKNEIPINIRNTNNPDDEGTFIVNFRKTSEHPIIGIASRNNFCIFNVEKILMDQEVGFGRRLLEIFEDYGLSYEHSPSGIDSISVILDQRQLELDKKLTNEIIHRIKEKLNPQSVQVEFNKCLICVAGQGLKRTPGLAARIATALGRRHVNIEILNQGASEISLIIGIDQKDAKTAVNAIYNEFYKKK